MRYLDAFREVLLFLWAASKGTCRAAITARFRRLCALLILLLTAIPSARASQSAVVQWDVDNDPYIAGYRVRYGTVSGQYSRTIDVGHSTVAAIPDLKRKFDYYVVVVAYDLDGVESLPSNEVVVESENQKQELYAAYNGSYTGSLVEGSEGRNASISLTLTGKGTFTGRLYLGNTTARFRGQFGLDGATLVSFTQFHERHLMSLHMDSARARITATIPGLAQDIEVALSRSPFSMTNPTSRAGHYSMIFQPDATDPSTSVAPPAASIAEANISSSGRIRAAVRLADGYRFTATSQLGDLASFDIYALLYRMPRGIVAGHVQLPGPEEASWSGHGSLWWFKPPQARGYYWRGFQDLLSVSVLNKS